MARKRKAKRTANNLLLKALIGFGLLLFLIGTFYHFQVFSNVLISRLEKPTTVISRQNPIAISIPKASLNVSVSEGGIKNGSWVLSDTAALFLPTSGKVGEGFNTLIYAHNTNNLFGKLKKAEVKDSVFLKDRAGKTFEYKIFEKKDVAPYNLKSLYSEEGNVVTLFTCDGWFDSKRLIVRARLIQ